MKSVAKKSVVMAAGAIILLSMPALGEYYRFVDENGMQRYTDDLSRVPRDQRPKVKAYESIKTSPVQPTNSSDAVSETSKAGGNSEGKAWSEKVVNQADEFDRMRTDLEKTQQSLEVERDALLKQKPSAGAGEEVRKAYSARVKQLNAKITDYEKQHTAYKEKVAAFNQTHKKE